jgi:4-amino-4-deoxy-L-arabinose transferase-like glycosyltransferase
MFAFYAAANVESRKQQVLWAIVFWASFGLSNLAKGPEPLPLVIPPILLYFAVFKEWKRIPKLLPVIGLLVFLAIMLPWYLVIMKTVPNWWFIWKHEVVDRAIGDTGAGNKWYDYIGWMFELTSPWVAFMIMGLVAPFSRAWQQKRRPTLYLWLWFVANIVIMAMFTGRRRHYILPAIPAMALLMGVILDELVFAVLPATRQFARRVLAGHIAVISFICVGAIFVVPHIHPELKMGNLLFCIVTIIAMAAIGLAFWRLRSHVATALTFAVTGVLITIMYVTVLNPNNDDWGIKASAQVIRKSLPSGASLKAYFYVAPRFVHYFGEVVPVSPDPNEIRKWYENGDYVMAEERKAPAMDKLKINEWMVIDNYTINRKRFVPATIYHKPAGGEPNSPIMIHLAEP